MSTTDINSLAAGMTDEQLALVVAEARRRKTAASKSAKYSKYEPVYSAYRKSVTDAKSANDLKKSLLADLKKMGFGTKVKTTTPATTPTTKGTKKK